MPRVWGEVDPKSEAKASTGKGAASDHPELSEEAAGVTEAGKPWEEGETPESDGMVQKRNIAATAGSRFTENSVAQNKGARKF